ncbi:MAG: DUF2950 domain-containing protein [Candidatus Omnitrophica bacterium]|nr:DUF2950 domain-containing protein [Candidatus Omnitrophota bacterium]
MFIALLMIIFSGWYALKLAQGIYMKMFTGKSENSQAKAVVYSGPQALKLQSGNSVDYAKGKGFMDKVRDQFYIWQVKRETELVYEKALKITNEKKTAAILKKFAAAQKVYKSRYGTYARRATELIVKEEDILKIIDPDLKVINYSYNNTRPTCGYYFEYLNTDENAANAPGAEFFLCAVPAEYGKLADNTLVINTRGIVYKKDTRGKPLRDIRKLDQSWVEF